MPQKRDKNEGPKMRLRTKIGQYSNNNKVVKDRKWISISKIRQGVKRNI